MPRRYSVDPNKGVLNVEWPLFGELSRALALKVARAYDPEIVVGIWAVKAPLASSTRTSSSPAPERTEPIMS